MNFLKALIDSIGRRIIDASRNQEHEVRKKNSIEVEFRVISDERQRQRQRELK